MAGRRRVVVSHGFPAAIIGTVLVAAPAAASTSDGGSGTFSGSIVLDLDAVTSGPAGTHEFAMGPAGT